MILANHGFSPKKVKFALANEYAVACVVSKLAYSRKTDEKLKQKVLRNSLRPRHKSSVRLHSTVKM